MVYYSVSLPRLAKPAAGLKQRPATGPSRWSRTLARLEPARFISGKTNNDNATPTEHMAAPSSPTEAQELRRLIPLNTLSDRQFEELLPKLHIEEAGKGTVLFHQGDTANEFVYVLSGTISLQGGGVEMDSVTGGSDAARFALAHQLPRKVSAVARDRIRYVRIWPGLIMPMQEPAGEAESEEVVESDDWMSILFRSPVFMHLPPANLQTLLRQLEEVEAKAGEVIFHQDEPGDYYYIIKHGQCVLTRKPTRTAREIKLATLKMGDAFGEDALLSDHPRSVTVAMATDGQLLRLDKAGFLKLVRDHVITPVQPQDALERVRKGAKWLDIRLPDVHQQSHPRGSINHPFFSLRVALGNLSRQHPYLVVCEDGRLSEAAVFLMIRHGFEAYPLSGGIGGLPPEELVSEPHTEVEMPKNNYNSGETQEIELAAALEAAGPSEPRKSPEPSGAESESLVHAQRELHRLERELARITAEKAKVEAERNEAQVAARQAEVALQLLEQEQERVLAERKGPATAAGDASEVAALRQEIEELKGLSSELQFEKASAEQEVESLEQQLAELKELVQEFVDHGEAAHAAEDAEALKAELEMVRQQAGGELVHLQALFRDADGERARLRSEVEKLHTQIQVRQRASSAAEEELQAAEKRRRVQLFGFSAAAGLLFTVLVFGLLVALEPGRELLRTLMNLAGEMLGGKPG
jgi:CRP-like cAMP-binding protein